MQHARVHKESGSGPALARDPAAKGAARAWLSMQDSGQTGAVMQEVLPLPIEDCAVVGHLFPMQQAPLCRVMGSTAPNLTWSRLVPCLALPSKSVLSGVREAQRGPGGILRGRRHVPNVSSGRRREGCIGGVSVVREIEVEHGILLSRPLFLLLFLQGSRQGSRGIRRSGHRAIASQSLSSSRSGAVQPWGSASPMS